MTPELINPDELVERLRRYLRAADGRALLPVLPRDIREILARVEADAATIERLTTEVEEAETRYQSAVKGRQDFRRAYRESLPVLRAAEVLSKKWRTAGQKVDSDDFFEAINAVDVAVTELAALSPNPDGGR